MFLTITKEFSKVGFVLGLEDRVEKTVLTQNELKEIYGIEIKYEYNIITVSNVGKLEDLLGNYGWSTSLHKFDEVYTLLKGPNLLHKQSSSFPLGDNECVLIEPKDFSHRERIVITKSKVN